MGCRLGRCTAGEGSALATAKRLGLGHRGAHLGDAGLLHARTVVARAELEGRYHLHQVLRLALEAASGCGHLLHQCCVLLGGLVHLTDGFTHLAHAQRLLVTGGADFAHDVSHSPDGADDFGHGFASFVDQGGALLDPFNAGADEGFDFLGGVRTASGQGAHFAGDHCKAAPLLSGAGGFDRGVQCQDVGLEGDAVDDTDDVGNLAAGVVDAFHGVHHLSDHLSTPDSDLRGIHGQLVGLAGAVGVLFDGAAELFHRRCGLLKGAGLLFGAGG